MYRSLLFLLAAWPLLVSAGGIVPFPEELREESVLYKKRGIQTVDVYRQVEGGDEVRFEVRQYDRDGRLTDKKTWDDYQEMFLFRQYAYRDDGLLARVTEGDGGEGLYAAEDYHYDSEGRLVRIHIGSAEGSYSVHYSYDSEGRIDSSFVADAEARKNAWHYTGNRLDSIVGYALYDYDDPTAWTPVETETFNYDRKGNLLREAFCSTYSGCYIREYTYKRSLVVSETVSGSDAEMYRETTEYRKKLPVKKVRTVAEGAEDLMADEVITYRYTFY